jgi:hypothetical protein
VKLGAIIEGLLKVSVKPHNSHLAGSARTAAHADSGRAGMETSHVTSRLGATAKTR